MLDVEAKIKIMELAVQATSAIGNVFETYKKMLELIESSSQTPPQA